MKQQATAILMYHSISQGDGPTCIDPETFRGQLAVLEDCGYRTISLLDFARWHRGEAELPSPAVVLTFDDGFADFVEHAAPEILSRNWTATLFLATGKLGGTDDWETPVESNGSRALMSWDNVRELAEHRFSLGAHSVSHPDLTRLAPAEMKGELVQSKNAIEQQIGSEVQTFAPPYGKCNRAVRAEIRRHFKVSVGTSLAVARRSSDLFNLPRVEMYYFRDLRRWRAFVGGHARTYFTMRRSLRRVRQIAGWRSMFSGEQLS